MNFQFSIKSVAEQTGLKFALSEAPKKGFVVTRPICTYIILTTGQFDTLCLLYTYIILTTGQLDTLCLLLHYSDYWSV